MDISAIIAPLTAFFQDGIGRIIALIAEVFYQLAYPSNADAAHVEIPTDALAHDASSVPPADK
ncbi:hypothetical protein ACFPVT_01330 [Corynebacterium choanae]|uniref:hypothetical protein n=1 Tax=Corynebacterium choanae TaxID=1862358 RepID=UPI000F515A6C|nr:hypothetical protein [Corynebacterium choanae]